MDFKSLRLKNFMSYQSQDFDDLSSPELILMSGVNGAGKSSIWDAISWAIFGQTVRGVKNDDVINRKFKKNCEVVVEIGIVGGTIKVSRYRKHETFGDKLFYEFKGKKIELGSLAATQDQLLKTIGIDFELFRCSILFAQGETFNFVDSGNKAQKEILSKVMRVDYSDGLAKAKAQFKKMQEERAGIAGKISALEGYLSEAPEDFDHKIEEWEADQKGLLEKNQDELDVVRADIAKLKAVDVEDYKDKRSKLKDLLSKVKGGIDTLSRSNSDVKAFCDLMTSQNKKLSSLKGECPTCSQDIDKDKIASITEENESKIKSKNELFESNDVKIGELYEKRSKIESEIEKLNEKISKATVVEDRVKSLKRLESKILESLNDLEDQVNPFVEMKEKAEKKRKDVVDKIGSLNQAITRLDEELPYYEFWVNGFGDSGIKSFVFDLICSNLTNKSNKYLNVLTNGEVTISFDTQKKTKAGDVREKFDCEIQKDGERIDYSSYSGGEKRRISLAVDMALSEIMSEYYGQKFGMVVFDEQTGYMDETGRVGFMRLLKEIAQEKRVFVVDHDAEFKAMFDEVWTVTKNKGVSQVIM